MFLNLQRKTKNVYHYFLGGIRKNKYFNVFNMMYAYDNSLWPQVHKVKTSSICYVISDFIHPSLVAYRGRELALCTSSRVVCYWMPGAKTQGQGFVNPGTYFIKLGLPISLKVIGACVTKVENSFSLCLIPVNELGSHRQVIPIQGNFLSYSNLEPEIKQLINQWLSFYLQKILNKEALKEMQDFSFILKYCRKLDNEIASIANKMKF